MATQKDVQIPNVTNGIIRSEIMDDSIAPQDCCELAINVHFDRIGAFTTRLGLSSFAPNVGSSIISLGSFAMNASTNRRLLVQYGTTIYSWDGATYNNVRTLSNTTKARYSQFLNLVYTVNGNGGDAVQTFNGTSYGTTNVGSLPKGDYVQAGYGGRVWVADKAADRLYYTDIVTPLGVITGGSNYIEKLSPQDGYSITGLYRHPRALLVFKQDYIIRVYSPNAYDLYPAYFLGTYSQESIVSTKIGMFFHSQSGFYMFQYDGQPLEISRKIYPVIKAIPRSQYENIFGWSDDDHAYWSIGDIFLKGVEYKNVVCVYSISNKTWTLYSYAQDLTCSVQYDTGSLLYTLIGTSGGDIAIFNSGYKDLGVDIPWSLTTRWIGFGDVYKYKQAKGFSCQHLNGAGTEINSQTDKETENTWRPLLKLTSKVVDIDKDSVTGEFNKLRIKYSGISSGEPVVVQGSKFLLLENKGDPDSNVI